MTNDKGLTSPIQSNVHDTVERLDAASRFRKTHSTVTSGTRQRAQGNVSRRWGHWVHDLRQR